MSSISPEELTRAVTERALELGFDAVGFAKAGKPDPEERLKAWLERGFAGTMNYMSDTLDKRTDLELIMPGAKSVVALSMSYYHPEQDTSGPLKVSRYAQGDDYHGLIRRRIRKLRKLILELVPEAAVKPTIDTSPILEREWAARAGIAWIGKSTMAIHPRLGTYTFLATLVTTADFVYDKPLPDRCGTCTACLDSCPTDAFVGPKDLDATKCITYWTVEHWQAFTEKTPELHGWVAGCDRCQEVCPWNKFSQTTQVERLHPRPELSHPQTGIFTEEENHSTLESYLKGTALQRTGAAAIRRNALKVIKGKKPP